MVDNSTMQILFAAQNAGSGRNWHMARIKNLHERKDILNERILKMV